MNFGKSHESVRFQVQVIYAASKIARIQLAGSAERSKGLVGPLTGDAAAEEMKTKSGDSKQTAAMFMSQRPRKAMQFSAGRISVEKEGDSRSGSHVAVRSLMGA